MNTFEELQRREIESARAKHKPINSAHEGYSVILEELDEFWEEVRKKRSERNPDRMVAELIQIAAMAQRTAEDVCMQKQIRNSEGRLVATVILHPIEKGRINEIEGQDRE